jgi:hypothetical protein
VQSGWIDDVRPSRLDGVEHLRMRVFLNAIPMTFLILRCEQSGASKDAMTLLQPSFETRRESHVFGSRL